MSKKHIYKIKSKNYAKIKVQKEAKERFLVKIEKGNTVIGLENLDDLLR